MRNAFVNALIELAEEDEKLVLLMAEVGYGVVEPFQERFPERFFNTGISEQSLVLTAAGMALRGYHPIAYSMSAFLATRAFEMIKNSVCYQNLPVTLVSIGTGLSYGELGSTHHGLEDEALMTVLPNMTVMFPGDAAECRSAIRYAVKSGKPAYIGLEKVNVKDYGNEIAENPIKWRKLRAGKDGAIIACGTLRKEAMEAAELLSAKGINVSVYGVNIVKPMDCEAIDDACVTSNLFVLDEHYSKGNLAGEIAKYILEEKKDVSSFTDCSVPDAYPDYIYNYGDLKKWAGLTVSNLMSIIEDKIRNNDSV